MPAIAWSGGGQGGPGGPSRSNAAELGVLGSSQADRPGVSGRSENGTSGKSGQPITIFPIPEVPLRTQSATTTITHAVTVAAGLFAPGHLGELTQYLPFELVDDVLEQTRTVQRRLRDLPSRTGVDRKSTRLNS